MEKQQKNDETERRNVKRRQARKLKITTFDDNDTDKASNVLLEDKLQDRQEIQSLLQKEIKIYRSFDT